MKLPTHGILMSQPFMHTDATRAVFDALAAGGAEARYVGGCVRDALVGRQVLDIDLATPARPERVTELLKAAGHKVIPTGIEHGTVTAVIGHQPFEITTLRRDVESHGRRATIAFTEDWEEDARRRDFTFNALYADRFGRIFDPTGGIADLKAGRVRFVGDPATRIAEDYLRLLRFFRFHAWFGGGRKPAADALAACAEAAPLLDRLSGERIQAELLKLLAAPDPAASWKLMRTHGILDAILPDADQLARLGRCARLEAVFEIRPDPVRRLAAVLRPRAEIDSLAARLKLSVADRRRLCLLADPPFTVTASLDAARARRALHRIAPELFVDLLLLADTKVSGDKLKLGLKEAADWTQKTFPLTGDDVMALGIRRGPEVGRLLDAVEDWWIAQNFEPDRDACLAELGRRARGEG